MTPSPERTEQNHRLIDRVKTPGVYLPAKPSLTIEHFPGKALRFPWDFFRADLHRHDSGTGTEDRRARADGDRGGRARVPGILVAVFQRTMRVAEGSRRCELKEGFSDNRQGGER